jgi:hypothetical protein
MESLKLTIELVPSTSWYNNVRSKVSKSIWNIIRRECYLNANFICEICGDNGKNQGVNHNVDCHEIWQYDDVKHIQKLIGFIALCPNCHLVKHAGFAQIKGKTELVIRQLIKVNDMTLFQAQEYLQQVFEQWTIRSMFEWKVDISFTDKYIHPEIDSRKLLIF